MWFEEKIEVKNGVVEGISVDNVGETKRVLKFKTFRSFPEILSDV